MGPIKNYVTCIMAFFIRSPTLHFVNFTLSPHLCYLLKINNYGKREKKIFYIYVYFSVLRYIKGGIKLSLHNHNFSPLVSGVH